MKNIDCKLQYLMDGRVPSVVWLIVQIPGFVSIATSCPMEHLGYGGITKEGLMEETKESQEVTYEAGDVIFLNETPMVFLLKKLEDGFVVGTKTDKMGENYEIKLMELWSFNTVSTYATMLDFMYPNQVMLMKGAILDSLTTLYQELGIEG